MSEKTEKLSFLKSQVQTRTATEQDVNFIFNSWLKSYKNSPLARTISAPVYYDFQHKTIEMILKQCPVIVACSSADPTQLYGYMVYEFIEDVPVIHYAYVKHSFRQMGIFTYMLAATAISPRDNTFYTHESSISLKLIREKSLPFIYNPYLAFGVK